MDRTRPYSYLASLVTVAALGLLLCGCGDPNSGPPRIVDQPVNERVVAGETAIFEVQAHGQRPLTYQWRKQGQDLYAATFPNYATPPAEAADNGEQFDVVITNSLGSVTSKTVNLTVNNPPAPPPSVAPEKEPTKKNEKKRRHNR
jgi:hypothetical protein